MVAVGVGIAAVIIIGLWAIQNQSAATLTLADQTTQDVSAVSKIKVVASFYPLYEFTKNIGGEKTSVSSFIPIGIEPHDWEPSAGDLLTLKEADIFVYNGAGIEPFVEKLIDSGEYPNVFFVETAHGIELIETEEYDEQEEEQGHDHDLTYNPHVWLDPMLAKHQVGMIRDAMIKVDPTNEQYYEDNAEIYYSKLDSLDSKIRSELSNCKKDTIVPFHNAFTYFAKRYEIKTFALSGVAPESEATAKELREIIDFVKENKINVIFAEELIDPKLANVLADEAGAQVLILSPLEGVSKEDLAKGTTYLDKMEENLQNIKIALECQ